MYPVITHILFDLDCTLYSARYGLERNVSSRINDYLTVYLAQSREEAWALRKNGVTKGGYGTTLEWLRAERGMNDAETERYFAAIHPENEADALPADPQLRSFLLSLSLPLGILTNSPLEHAQRILDRLGVPDLFPVIFDIRRNGLEGKPRAKVYRRVLAELGVEASSCLLVDDASAYVEGYRAIGGTGVYFDEDNHRPDFPGFRIQKLEELPTLTWPDNSPLLRARIN
jgi:putative hydrolase of the HAD superfamily